MMLFKNLNFVIFFEDMSFFKRIPHKILKIFKPENDKAVGEVCSTADFFLSIIGGMLEEKNKSL
ncbi:hypothetical protein ACVNPX_12315 [Staphylococcus aureus]